MQEQTKAFVLILETLNDCDFGFFCELCTESLQTLFMVLFELKLFWRVPGICG